MNTDSAGGRLATNIMHFARTLRAAGLPIGSGRVLDARVDPFSLLELGAD